MKKVLPSVIIVLLSVVIVVLVGNDYRLYSVPILKIQSVKNVRTGDEDIRQEISGVIKNGKYKGRHYTFSNKGTYSEVYDDIYHRGEGLFVKVSKDGSTVDDVYCVKRDVFVVAVLLAFVDLLLIVGRGKGVRTLLSLTFNTALSVVLIYLYLNKKIHINILLMFGILAVVYTVVSLYACNGKGEKTKAAILSSLFATAAAFLLSFTVLSIFKKSVYFWFMDYSEAIFEQEEILFVNILLSSLGAIMDISVTVSSSLAELIQKDNTISTEALKKSGTVIAGDVLGTMTNIMLYTCIISVIPIALIMIKNGFGPITVFREYGQIEIIRLLTACIGIVLAVPISQRVCLFVYRGRRK